MSEWSRWDEIQENEPVRPGWFLYDLQDFGRFPVYRPDTGYWRWRESVKRDLRYLLPIICRPLVKLERWLRLLRP
jgi:hypothetical protein